MRKQLPALFLAAAVGACGGSNGQPPAEQSTGAAAEAPAAGGGAPANAPGSEANSGRSAAAPPAGPSSAASGSAAAPAGSAPAPAAPAMMEMDVPSGTELVLTLETAVSSETAKPEETVRATVAKPIVIAGMTVVPEGAPVTGTVVAVERSGRVKGRASIALRFDEVTVAKTPYKIRTARIARQAEATKAEDAKKIGIGAGVGTAIGAIAGGKKGAAIGAAVGGGAGTGAVLATRGDEVTIPAGATLKTTIEETVKINAEM